MFFNSYLLPIFDYADIIWRDRGNVASMEQNKAARMILHLIPLSYLSHWGLR